MMVTIRGRDYKARFCSVLMFEKAMFLYERALKAREEGRFDDYAKTWLEYCQTIFEGDVEEIGLDKLTPEEMKVLIDFFTGYLAEATRNLNAGKQTSPDSSSGE